MGIKQAAIEKGSRGLIMLAKWEFNLRSHVRILHMSTNTFKKNT